ncbi:hypothetical protein MRB53_037843 [Persea americana]|nr:hypothetical protein MRB53_037843 [Persea americana]
MSVINSTWSSTIEQPPSCVAFCPQCPEIVVVGTYLLHEAENTQTGSDSANDGQQTRTGTLQLFRCKDLALHELQAVALSSAVLDIEWSPHVNEHGNLLVVATSTGSLDFYKLENEQLKLANQHQVSGSDVLVLDVLWHPVLSNIIGITSSTGEVVLCSIKEESRWPDNVDVKLDVVTTHMLEPWTLAFSINGREIYSGGDDMVFQCSTIDDLEAPINLWRDRKQHSAGVTSILPLSADMCLTGSYDDHIRLLGLPVQGSKSVLAELDLGGGVWRMKLLHVNALHRKESYFGESSENDHMSSIITSRSYTILASCMHAGARIVELKQQHHDSTNATQGMTAADWHFEVKAKFVEHTSMNYGSDTHPYHTSDGKVMIVSSSFYDRRICLWQYDSTEANLA